MKRYKLISYKIDDLSQQQVVFTDDRDFAESCKHKEGYALEILQYIDLWEKYIPLYAECIKGVLS